MKLLLCLAVLLAMFAPSVCIGEVIRLRATADTWLSSVPKERGKSSGKNTRLKLKTIQEMAAIRFDIGVDISTFHIYCRGCENTKGGGYVYLGSNRNWHAGKVVDIPVNG